MDASWDDLGHVWILPMVYDFSMSQRSKCMVLYTLKAITGEQIFVG